VAGTAANNTKDLMVLERRINIRQMYTVQGRTDPDTCSISQHVALRSRYLYNELLIHRWRVRRSHVNYTPDHLIYNFKQHEQVVTLFGRSYCDELRCCPIIGFRSKCVICFQSEKVIYSPHWQVQPHWQSGCQRETDPVGWTEMIRKKAPS
jgi:hypothetical protein